MDGERGKGRRAADRPYNISLFYSLSVLTASLRLPPPRQLNMVSARPSVLHEPLFMDTGQYVPWMLTSYREALGPFRACTVPQVSGALLTTFRY